MKQYRNIGQIVIGVLIFSLFLIVVHQFIIPVILGMLISLIFRPIYLRFCNFFGNRRGIAAFFSTILIVFCVLCPVILLTSYVIKDVVHLVKEVNDLSAQQDHSLMNRIYDGINKIYPLSKEQFEEIFRENLKNAGEAGKNAVRAIATSIPRKLTAMIFFLISFYFGLLDGPRLVAFIEENSPFPARDTSKIFQTVVGICDAVVLGSLLAGLVQGTILGSAYWILGIPKPLFFGVLTLLFGLIPLVGSGPAGAGGTVYLLITGHPIKAIFMLAAFALAGVSDNIVKPLVLKGKASLHPFLGLISVLGGLKTFGIAGVFLGPLITALTIVLLQVLHHRVKTMREAAAKTSAG
jgi:predicted PurR-regulated permease PerM